MANKFSPQIIEKTLQIVIKKHNFEPEHLMSTSGEFFVMTLRRGNKKFLIKIRKNKGSLARKKFINEIATIKFLNKIYSKKLLLPKIFVSQTKTSPEYFIYEYIKGFPLNNFYISIGKRLTDKFLQTNFIEIFHNLHLLKIPANIALQKNTFVNNYKIFKGNQLVLKKYISNQLIKKINVLLINQARFFNNTPLVLSHGDINPKNIVLSKNKLALIDWSEVHLNNQLFDLSSLYLFAWNRPDIKTVIKDYIFGNHHQLINSYHLFLLNRLILIPKNIQTMENSILGLSLDKKNKIILPETEIKLKKIAKQAIANYIIEIERIVWHLSLWQKPNSVIRAIEIFYSFVPAKKFISAHLEKFGLNKNWQLKKLINHRFVARQGDQKLITEYVFTNGQKSKIIMGKIRLERGDDLAKQSYQIIKKLWQAPEGKELISQPLYYFAKHHLYIYEKTLGVSLADLIENKKNQNTKILIPLIKRSAAIMSKLHQVPIKNFSKVNFYKNYDLTQQLNWLEKNLYKNKEFKNKKNISLLKNLRTLQKKVVNWRANNRVFIHGDFQLQNLILYKNKLRLIDFDNAEINDPLIDVGNFLNQINYKNLLFKKSYFLRQLFLQTYLKQNQQELNQKNTRVLNFYIIMGIIKNINLNFLENKNDLVIYDLKKINYIYNHLTVNPVDNLSTIKKILT